jgi:hypothetical protein
MPEVPACRLCEAPGVAALGLCNKHYHRYRAAGKPALEPWIEGQLALERDGGPSRRRRCLVCGQPADAWGLCHKHAERYRRAGKPELEPWVARQRAQDDLRVACVICGTPFHAYQGRLTCSRACYEERLRRAARARLHAETPDRRAERLRRRNERDRLRRAAPPGDDAPGGGTPTP